ncbi:3-oxoacyl-ACP synthase III family protein [Nocardia cyriacigeorgica]|uniref:3-oxoacyl-ACP synthase III family protein n=1 Tax=Nocardia cyriacigeorgica TaxID=135487 RepID=UPI0018945D89|nr:3-oxoacyl-ACP synthase III family protein [Nocardia cyriacigeorgica]MBF6344348.1 3-oxoacyl-ACP synthase III family protein [Nocardia cyriacigeorgica]
MTESNNVAILGTGSFLPGDPIDNDQLEKLVGPLPADVLDGIQVRRRHWLIDPADGSHRIGNSRMAEAAARTALERAGVAPEEVDLIVVSTASPEFHLPTVGSYVQQHLGLERCAVIEVRAGCVGAIQALDIAYRQLADGTHCTALVIGTEAISPILAPMFLGREPDAVRMRDRLTLYNFGDGAAAVVLRADTSGPVTHRYGYVNACMGGARKPGMVVVGGGTDLPVHEQLKRKRLMDITLDAAGVAEFGPRIFVTALRELLDRSGLRLDQIDACVLPEGNADYFSREFEEAGLTRADYDLLQSRIVENLTDVGATGSPAVLLALDAGLAAGRITPGSTVLLVAIEASRYVYAGLALRWPGDES